MLKHLLCLWVMVALQVSCGGRNAPLPDGTTDGPGLPDSTDRDGPLPLDQQAVPDVALNPDLFAALHVEQLSANCMPMVPQDPVFLSAHAEFLNNGAIAVGPIQLDGARLLGTAGAELGTFEVKPIASFVIKPGEGLSSAVEKVPGTLKPAGACGLCGKPVKVEIAYSGAGIPAGARLVSAEAVLFCAY